MAVPTESLGLLRFGREVRKKNRSLPEEIEVLQKAVSKEQTELAVFEEKLTDLKSLDLAYSELVAKLSESDKALYAALADLVLLKNEVVCVDTDDSTRKKGCQTL